MPKFFSARLPQRGNPFLQRSTIRVAVAIGAIAATAFILWPRAQSPAFYFELTMRSSLPGFAQLHYDVGSGVNGKDSFRVSLEGGNHEVDYKFPLPEGRYLNLRFNPTDRALNTMTLSRVRIVDRSGSLVRNILPSQIKAIRQIERLQRGETETTLTTGDTASDPVLLLETGGPVILKNFAQPSIRTLLRRFLIAFVLATALGLLAAPLLVSKVKPLASGWTGQALSWFREHPVQLLLATAAVSVILSCYPIVFFGKSFLSPNNHSHTCLLYGEMPTVPGYKEALTDDEKGSDLGAAMWYSWPTSVVESRALLKYFELPLWNRYDSCGLPLLGQGQSMFGDPLHFLVLLTNGAPGWWDLKYLLAKFLFAACLGLCVLQLTKHLPAALIISLTAPFIGFFSYRYSHPGFFSMCYAPSILLCWFKLIEARNDRRAKVWLGLMVLANWTVMNSGTVKEAYILLLAMNFCGLLTLCLARAPANKSAKLRQALWAQVIFVLIATPVWLTFLDTLRSSWTVYDIGGAFQIQPGLFIGLFDDIFYRQFNADELHYNPSLNFLVLGGVLWFCLSGRRIDQSRLSWGLSITCLLALAFVFGVVPPSFIVRLPFLAKIYHIDNTFSGVAIVCLLLLAGSGIKAFWDDCQTIAFRRIYFRLLVGLAGLVAIYLGTTEAAQRSTRSFFQIGDHIPKSGFFWGYSSLLVVALAAAPLIGREAIRSSRVRTWHVLSLGLLLVFFHWYTGMHLATPFDAYVMNPHQRTNLIADSSPAVRLIRSRMAEPSRSVGLNYNLYPGYGGAIGVEQIDSPDPLLNKYYRSLMDASGIRLQFGSSHVGLVGDQLVSDLPLLDMLNVRYYLGDAITVAEYPPVLTQISSLDLNVYESSTVWPRAFFSDRLLVYGSENDFVRLLKEGDGRPFAAISQTDLEPRRELATLAHDPLLAARQIVPAIQYALTGNSTSFTVKAPAAGVMVLTEPYVEGDFQLRVNGKPASYFRVNSAFRGVYLPEAGEYHFSFSYWPRHLTISLWISGFGIVLLLLWLTRKTTSES